MFGTVIRGLVPLDASGSSGYQATEHDHDVESFDIERFEMPLHGGTPPGVMIRVF